MRTKHKVYSVIFAFLGLCVFSSLAVAQTEYDSKVVNSDIAGRIGIGGIWGYIDQDEDNQDSRYNLAASLIFGLSETIALELEGGTFMNKDYDDTLYYTGFLDLVLRAPVNSFSPYIRGGLGMQNEKIRDLDDWDDSFSQRVGAGIEYFLNRNISLNGEALYVWGGDATFDTPIYRAGLRLYF
jgi:opacity protein-like surface antigen